MFCKNSQQLEVVEYRTIEEEMTKPDWEDVKDELNDEESCA